MIVTLLIFGMMIGYVMLDPYGIFSKDKVNLISLFVYVMWLLVIGVGILHG